jgi:hypothetical protein
VRDAAAELPDPGSLAPGTLVLVGDGSVARETGLLGRVMRRRRERPVPRSIRCTALLARGYARIGGGVDEHGIDWAWGYAP